jgi:hypothetical protein
VDRKRRRKGGNKDSVRGTRAAREEAEKRAHDWFFSDAARAERAERQRQLERDGLLEYSVLAPGAPVELHGLTGAAHLNGHKGKISHW